MSKNKDNQTTSYMTTPSDTGSTASQKNNKKKSSKPKKKSWNIKESLGSPFTFVRIILIYL